MMDPANPVAPAAARAWLTACVLALSAVGAYAQPFLLATDPAGGSVVALDLDGGGPPGSFTAGAMPAGAALSADGTRLFVADAGSGELRVIDPASGPVGSVAVGAGAAGVALCAGGGRVVVALAQEDAVAVVDTATLAVLATLPVDDQPLAVACAGGFLAAASYGAGTLAVFDAVSLGALGTVDVGDFPAGVAIGGDRAWVTSLLDSTVTVVELPAATVLDTVPVGSAPRGIAVSGGRVFVANVNDATLTVLDALTALVVATVPLPTPGPTDLLAQGDLYVAHLGEPAVTVVSTGALAVTATLAAPTGLLALGGVTEGGITAAEIPALGPAGLIALAAGLALLALRWRGGLVVLLLAAGAGTGAAVAQPVTYSDATFAAADWEVVSATGTHQAFQSAVDGDGPPSRQMVHFSLPGETIRVVHRWLAASHDPASAGAVAGLEVAWDRRATGIDCPAGEAAEAFVVFQGGVAYRAAQDTFENVVWEGTGATGLAAGDFTDGSGGTPDFSASGAALSFGYERTTVNETDSPPRPFCHGMDNFAVTVSIPDGEPAGESLIGLAPTSYFPLEGEDLVVSATRTGDPTEPASVQVSLSTPFGAGPERTLTWPAGAGGEATATFPGSELGEGLEIRALRLSDASPGAVIDPRRDSGMVYVANDPLAGLWAGLLALLASWDLAGLLLLAALALLSARGRRREE